MRGRYLRARIQKLQALSIICAFSSFLQKLTHICTRQLQYNVRLTQTAILRGLHQLHVFLKKQHFYKQHQAKIDKNSSKC